jgi:LuxR family maltose regulon positive regulatory protein
MARIELERHRLDRAEAYLDDGLRIARPGGQGELLRAGRYLCAHLAAARGNQGGAIKILQDTERIVEAMDDPYLSGELAWEWAVVCLNTGDLNGARTRLADLEKMCTVTRHANLLLVRDWMTVRLLCDEARYDEALAELTEAIGRVRASNSTGQLVRLLALQAVALDATGKHTSARSTLREGLALGAPGGYVRRWLDAGPSIASLLHDVRDKGNTPRDLHPYLDALLDACRSAFGDVAFQPAPQMGRHLAGEMLDPLTARELEIVRLICAGHSGPEIASELVIAYNTVRKHISNIYSKLGVRSRTQAIARVHELNLL